MSSPVPLYEVEKAKKMKNLSSKILGTLWKVTVWTFWAAVAAGLGTVGWAIYTGGGWIWTLVYALVVVVGGSAITATVMEDKALAVLRQAQRFGTIDE